MLPGVLRLCPVPAPGRAARSQSVSGCDRNQGRIKTAAEKPGFFHQHLFYFPAPKKCTQNALKNPGKAKNPLHCNGFFVCDFIPTRRIKSFSKLFCLVDLIRHYFVLYRLYLSCGLSEILLSKIYQPHNITGYS